LTRTLSSVLRAGRSVLVYVSSQKIWNSGSDCQRYVCSCSVLKHLVALAATHPHLQTPGIPPALPNTTTNPIQTRPPTTQEADLIHTTSTHLLQQYPILGRDTGRTNHPNPSQRSTQPLASTQQPFRLHRFMVPPAFLSDRSIAFAGAMYTLGTFPLAYIQSLWIAAYFDDKLTVSLPSPEKTLEETYLHTQYCAL
jgi:hypothetical protein